MSDMGERSWVALLIGATWIAFLVSFEFPIPQDILIFWLVRGGITALALVGVVLALSGNARWRLITTVAATLLVATYAVRMAVLASDAASLEMARGSSGPLEHLLLGGKKVFLHYWGELDAPFRAMRFAYREAVMPLIQLCALLYLALTWPKRR